MRNLRSHDKIRTANIEMYLFIKIGYEKGLSFKEMRKMYKELLQDNTADNETVQRKLDKLYRIHYTHFKNK